MKCYLLLITCIILFSCGSDEITIPVITKPNYFPDDIGSRWVYRNSDGQEWSREITSRKDTQDNNFQKFIYNPPISDTDIGFLKPISFQVNQDNIRLAVSDKVNRYIQTELPNSVQDNFTGLDIDVVTEQISYPALVYLHLPLTTNLHWEALDVIVQGNLILQDLTLLHISFEVTININAVVLGQSQIETPAGSFEDTYQIEYQIETTHKVFSEEDVSSQRHSIWFTPHVGIVKIEDSSGISELVEYTLK